MSQPASFDQPRDGETVLACPHDSKWKRKLFFVGDIRDGKPTGLGLFVRRRATDEGIWVRWVVLCWWCSWRRARKRQEPVHRAKCEMIWSGK
jgi:hypothetical protein